MDLAPKHLALIERLGRTSCQHDEDKPTTDAGLPCGETPVRVQLVHGTRFGLKASGKKFTEEEFLLQLDVELDEPDHSDNILPVENLRVFCEQHSGPSGATPVKPDQLGDSGAGPDENKLLAAGQQRELVIEKLGGVCRKCGSGRRLAVVLAHGLPGDFWAQQGCKGWVDKFAWLALEPDPTKVVELLCAPCSALRTSNSSGESKQNLRERVIEGYGRICGVCAREVDSRTAWLVRLPGTPKLKFEGSGRKLTSRQKYERLLKDGCPGGWELRCPEHGDGQDSR